jgi:ribonuclease D
MSAALDGMSSSPVVAVDTESNSRHRYPEQLCLVQLSDAENIYLIDTIQCPDISALGSLLDNPAVVKVLHGADYDLRVLDRHAGLRIRGLFDTSIAARFVGRTEFGLSSLLRDILGLTIPKNESLQKADWGQRPLSPQAMNYAADDVRFLLPLQLALQTQTDKLGRSGWVAEEFRRAERIRYSAPDPETAFLSIKNSGDLDSRALATLRSLYAFREKEALRLHRPPFFILPDAAMVYLSDNPGAPLTMVPGINPMAIGRLEGGILQALRAGQAAQPFERPRPVRDDPLNEAQMRTLAGLKSWRIGLGTRLSLEPFLVWPTPSLTRIARDPGALETEIMSEDVRDWQRTEIAPLLRVFLGGLRTRGR